MVRWVVGSILHGGPIDLFFVRECSTTGVTKALWERDVAPWDGAYKRTLAANRKE